MPPSNFDKDVADREYIRDELNFLEHSLNSHSTTALTLVQVDMFLQQASEAQTQLRTNHSQMKLHAPSSTDMGPLSADYYNLRERASRIYSGLHGIKGSFPPPATPTTSLTTSATSSTTSTSKNNIKLPRLEIPKFSGNLLEWINFRDMFVAAVHDANITNVERLTQLKSLLTGEAARQIRSIVLSDSNYVIAWKALQDRYENNRELLFAILRRLISQPAVTTTTSQNLRTLLDTTKECIRSLEVLAIPTQHWDAIISYLLFSKMDASSRELWEQTLTDTSVPVLSKMYEFLEQRSRALAASQPTAPTSRHQGRTQQQPVRTHHISSGTCKFGCNTSHSYFKCPTFKGQTPQQRVDTVKRLNLCSNCLMEGHFSSSCTSQHTCKSCSRKHHTLLHLDGTRQTQNQTSTQQQTQPSVSTHHVNPSGVLQTGILATARIQIVNSSGNNFQRALVDPGATNSHITERAARQMNLNLRPCNIPMTGLAAASLGSAKYITSFAFTPHFNSMTSFSVTALVVKSITTSIPSDRLRKDDWHHLNGLELADPEFESPDTVDILLGTDICWNILENEKKEGKSGQPFAVKSTLGWLVAGPNTTSSSVTTFTVNADLNFQLQRFWEQEDIFQDIKTTTEEEACEKHFSSTHRRDITGRFTVRLPFKAGNPQSTLGSSRQAALKRFYGLENKFIHHKGIKDSDKIAKLTNQWSEYISFMREYENLGHMSPVPLAEVHSSKPTYYIPHHCVLKESSTTTKLRVVFDASAPTSSGVSMNECQMVGPPLQDAITDIMLRFRFHLIAFVADIAKMYRQILVADEDTDFQRILWRENPSLLLQDYRLRTVTYGTSSAPYLAVKCLQQLAKDEQHRFPDAVAIALKDFYVDDTASGCDTLERAKVTVQQLMDLCASGGFSLRKWTTNDPSLLEFIPEELRETNTLVQMQTEDAIKTLGVFWNPAQDKYLFRLSLPPDTPGKNTKRSILSAIAKIYDPLGWLSPAIIVCKIFMQDLWKTSCDWDDLLPETIQVKWQDIRTSLQDIENIEIPRCVISSSPLRYTLIGCSDASIKAISAVIYILCEYDSQPHSCRLLTSKTRVAPVKYVTLPRLELNGAVLLSQLIKSTLKAVHVKFDEVRAFTDSTITLHWVTSTPSKWKPYIRRRVQAIQDNVPTAHWYHIAGKTNPADCASRGISSVELLHHRLWWNGTDDFLNLRNYSTDLLEEELVQLEAECQPVKIHHAQIAQLHPLLCKFSSFSKLQRVMAFILRFLNNWVRRRQSTPLLKGSLTVSELLTSHNYIIRLLQQVSFPDEYEALEMGHQISTSSNMLKLQPFIAEDRLLRVGGRLRKSAQPFNKKHPILLPKGHHITSCIIREIHLQLLHAGPSATLAALQQRYWVINGRDSVRMVLRKCITCTRHRASLMSQLMGDLPYDRVNPALPFSKVGVDYAGPFSLRPMIRSKVTLKCWLAIFVCFTTRAIHIEVVSSMSTDAFLAALRRFIHRRGKPCIIYSDCGTNFKGTDKVLRDFYLLSQQQSIQDACSTQQIQWHFNPPGAPHFGGLWEAGVKSIKHHLKRVMGAALLTYEELLTLVVQIEGILNSRPLVPASHDPSDLGVLTPAHFLIGRPITAPPEQDLMDVRQNHLRRWQLLQQQQQLFWKRWSNEYLTRLQQRPKWWKPSANLEVGNLVIIKEERLPPLKWKLGRVVSVHPGADGRVRVATLKTSDGEIKRPIVKLSLLPITNYEQ